MFTLKDKKETNFTWPRFIFGLQYVLLFTDAFIWQLYVETDISKQLMHIYFIYFSENQSKPSI